MRLRGSTGFPPCAPALLSPVPPVRKERQERPQQEKDTCDNVKGREWVVISSLPVVVGGGLTVFSLLLQLSPV